MAQRKVSVPNIGDTENVDVIEILVKPGMRVEPEQPLIVLESEKASMEVPSPSGGVVREISVKLGDKVSEGSPILTLELEEAGQSTVVDAKPAAPTVVTRASSVPPVESSAREPLPPSAASVVDSNEPRPPIRTVPPALPVEPPSQPPPTSGLPYASPAIRRLARELGVDLRQVPGSTPAGRITKDDVQAFVKQSLNRAASGPFALNDAPDIDFTQFGPTRIEALTKIQRLTGSNLHRSWVTIPHVTQFDAADITDLEAFRKQARAEQPELKLTLVAFFAKALVPVLKSMPRFNASLDKQGENLVLKGYYHIGIAVDTPNGLVVPVLRDVDRKSVSELAAELEAISERARARRLSASDLQGASFTISSLGGIGGSAFTPIINPPQVAVLGVSRARLQPVFQDGGFVPRLMCPLSLSYDHRVIDGADAARFTTRLSAILGDIRKLLL